MRIKPSRMDYDFAKILYDDEVRKINNECYLNGIEILNISPAGSLRRKRKTIGDLDLVINTSNNKLFKKIAEKRLDYYPTQNDSFLKKKIIKSNIDMFVADQYDFYSMLFFLTGSEDWNLKIMGHLYKNSNIRFTQFSFLEKVDNKLKFFKFSSEKEIFNKIGLEYVTPELRIPKNIKFIEGTNEQIK